MADESLGARVQFADRTQTEFCVGDVDALLPWEHPARTVWAYVEGLDLSPWYGAIRAARGGWTRCAIRTRRISGCGAASG